MMEIDINKTKIEIINWIKEWFEENGPDCNAVLGISGGKDSTIAAALCVEALGKERVIGVLLPNGEQSDISDAYEVCKILQIPHYEINIKPMVDASYKQMEDVGIEITTQTRENLPPRERTKIIRAICQSKNGRMINTCNLSEIMIGYFTIGGDGEGDMSPLEKLTKTEVVMLGDSLNLPKHLIHKAPADGLCGKTDEDNFGFTYEDLDNFLRHEQCSNEETKQKIIDRIQKTEFKRNNTNAFYPSWKIMRP